MYLISTFEVSELFYDYISNYFVSAVSASYLNICVKFWKLMDKAFMNVMCWKMQKFYDQYRSVNVIAVSGALSLYLLFSLFAVEFNFQEVY